MYLYYFLHILLLSVILHSDNISCETTNCVLSYYADEISYDDASSLNFYYTSVNVKSVDECANFCFHREFCRTAVYNYFANTCSISYNWMINCRSYSKRYSQYQSPRRQLVRIACIDSCKISVTETQAGNDLRQIRNLLLRSGIEITHDAPVSGEHKKGSITIPQSSNTSKFTSLERTGTVYNVLITAAAAAAAAVPAVQAVQAVQAAPLLLLPPPPLPPPPTPTTTTTTAPPPPPPTTTAPPPPTTTTTTAPPSPPPPPTPTTTTSTITTTPTTTTSTTPTITTTTTTTTTTVTTTRTETTATATTTMPISTTNAERVANIEENNSVNAINCTVPIATTVTTTTNTVGDDRLPYRKIFQPFDNETFLWWIYLQKLLEKNMHTYQSIIDIFDNIEKIAISNPETFMNDVNSEDKLSVLEEIAHKLQENPSKYKVSVEHPDDLQSLIVIRVSNYRKRKNLHENIPSNIPPQTNNFPARRDSPEELKSNYHAIHIKLPYKFITNATLDEEESQEKQAHKDSQNTFDADMQRLDDNEEKSKFKRLPEKYIASEHGYLYRIQIHDINRQLPFTNNITTNPEMRRKKIESSKTEESEHKDDNISKRKTMPVVNPPCFGMISRQLLHNASYKTLYDVSLEQCRCTCANTWNEEGCVTKCKSFQYSNTTRKCQLNEDDHNGKFDLVYDWNTNYFYRICVVKDIIKDALRNCPPNRKVKFGEIALEETNANLDTEISDGEGNEIVHWIRKRSTIDHRLSPTFRTKSVYWWKKSGRAEVSNKTVTEEVLLSPGLWSKILKRKSSARNLKSLILGVVKKESEELSDRMKEYKYNIEIRHGAVTTTSTSNAITTTTTSTTITSNIPHVNREIRSTKNSDWEAIRKPFDETTIFPEYITETTVINPLHHGEEVGDVKKSDGTSDDYNNNYGLNENNVTTITPINRSDEMTISEELEIHQTDFEGANKIKQSSTSEATEKCFEVIDGFLLKGTAGGLEQEVTLEECQCYCANSRSNKRYSFQCVSATYYHDERDCILNLQTRNDFPKQFKQQDNVSYLGMICSVEVSKRQLVNTNLTDGCREVVSMSTSTKPGKVFTPVHTDSCFVEMPNHVLYGTAFGAETNVSVEACKCYCMSAERQYGIECRSIEYYFDSRTCLLSNLSRTTNPINFNYSIIPRLMHSYFDKTCSIQNNEFSIYVKEKCLFAMELKPVNSNSSLNFLNEIDSSRNAIIHSNEVTNVDKHIGFTDSRMISTINSIYSSQYATPSTTLNDLLKESGKKEGAMENSVNELEDLHLSTTIYATTATSTPDNFTNFVTTADLFPEANDTTVTTIAMKTNYDTFNQTFETTPTVEIATYPHLGRCVYSAIYQTSFRGTKLIKRFLVFSPQQCFYGCHFEGCRSSNLIQVDNQTNSCELFSDALIDYRTSDVLVYDRGSVYFDGIQCNARRRKVNRSSSGENDNSIDNENHDDDN